MRNIPVALNAHIQNEVISLAKLLKITKLDGSVVRATTHDENITVGDETYFASVAFDVSAIQSTDTLSVDNAEINMGLDETIVKKADFENGLYDNAEFDLLFVNWENPTDGTSYLKRGTLGDITINNDVSVTIGLRGLTQSLQKNIVERYSPTCRVNLGGKKCGVVNSPLRVRRKRQRVKTFDWFLVPSANITPVSVTNNSFEANGVVANGTSGITNWTHAGGSYWKVRNDFTGFGSTYYLEGGDDGAGASTGTEFTLYREYTTSALGMSNTDVDNGNFTIDMQAVIAATSSTSVNSGRVFIELLNSSGVTLKLENSDEITPVYQEWEGIGATCFVLPGTRSVRIGLRARKLDGASATVAFDEVDLRYWTNEASTFGDAVFRTMRIPTLAAVDYILAQNASFNDSGPIANGNAATVIPGWAASGYWRTLAASGALTPNDGGYFLVGGDNATTTPAQEYTLSSTLGFGITPLPAALDITNGWYYTEIRAKAAFLDADSSYKFTLSFLNSLGASILDVTTGYQSGGTVETWNDIKLASRVPSGATQMRLTLYAKSGAGGSAANVAFDNVQFIMYPTAYEGALDAELGLLGATLPTYAYPTNDYTTDGSVLVQARDPVFDFGTVTNTVDTRSFEATSISDTAALLYSGKITWLSGANAGKNSYVRVWNNTSKIVRMYDSLQGAIAIGDKFVYARGCDKTIARCADVFGNAHNFRGEPYLPGTAKVIDFIQVEA